MQCWVYFLYGLKIKGHVSCAEVKSDRHLPSTVKKRQALWPCRARRDGWLMDVRGRSSNCAAQPLAPNRIFSSSTSHSAGALRESPQHKGHTHPPNRSPAPTHTADMRPILLSGHERALTQVKYNPDGDLIFSVSKDHVVCAWCQSPPSLPAERAPPADRT